MATIKTEINKLVARCRRVGWTAQRATGDGHGWKVYFDDHSSYLIHQTYSDDNAPKRVERFLISKGLLEKEAALDDGKAANKSVRLTAARKAADAKAEKMAAEAALTTRAAGPYAGPEVVPLDWFLMKHPAPWMRQVIIDPALAAAILKRNIDNRPILPSSVAYYRRLIEAGNWHFTHQGGAQDIRGVVQDGQHRLLACVEAGQPISMPWWVGMPVENFKAIDEGKNRSIADLLGKDEVANRVVVGAALRLVAAYREPFPRRFLKYKTPNEALYDTFKGDPDRMAEAIRWAVANKERAKIVGGALAAATYLLREANGRDNQFVQAFLTGLVTSVKGGGDSRTLLDKDDPRMILRTDMQNRRERGNRLRAVDQLGYILLAWNLVVDRSQAGRRIKWNEGNDDIPQIVVCRDKGATASAVPDKLRGEFTS